MDTTTIPEGLQVARDYIKGLESDQFGWDLMIGDAFIRGMRDIGYKSTAFAVAELIDNPEQSDATTIDVIFGYDKGAKPTSLAVVDDGHGMDGPMARASLVWGAGTRAEDREGLGKYGYGLPSASVSQCRRVTVYSKPVDGNWTAAYLDIDEIKNGKWTHGNRIVLPDYTADEPPAFVVDYLKKAGRWDTFEHGTVVVWEHLDRVEYRTQKSLRDFLLAQLGVIYRNILTRVTMTVDGAELKPCDPLFLTEGFLYYDEDEDRAIGLPPATIEVTDKATGDVVGKMRIRMARMPATFFRKPEAKHTYRPSSKDMNANRLKVATENNGIIFLRNGRQIDVVRPPRRLGLINATTDRFWAVEVDFDATLDEEFSITTSKQQVTPSDRIWDMLAEKGKVWVNIGQMRSHYDKEAQVVRDKAEEETHKRASIEAIEQAKKFRSTKPPADTPQRRGEATRNLENEAKRRAEKAGLKPEQVMRDLEANEEGNPLVIETEDMPDGPFFRCEPRGGQRVLFLNVAHPFYTQVYAGRHATAHSKAGLEILLWALGEAEVDADPDGDKRKFYVRERVNVWSPYIADSVTALAGLSLVSATADVTAEEMQEAEEHAAHEPDDEDSSAA